uniref:basic salivary proline-rich protein 1-like n=1 Tax=Solea senegalensis TaxID=28829 RepID=UPI001CD8AF34|nr:basic salivary proline-rich protein 1-like [Solea senegalensis]
MDRGRTTPHPGRPQRPRVPAPRACQRPRAGPAHHRGEQSPPQTAHQGGTVRYPPQPPPPPPRSRPHAPQPREGQAEAHVGPLAKGAPRDGREADSRAGPDPPGRGRASGPRTRRAQPRGAPERGPPTSGSICDCRRPPPGRQTAAHHSTFREVRHDEPQPCLPDTPQTERRGSDPPRPATPHGHHCCPHPDRQSQHGRGVSRNRVLRSAPNGERPHHVLVPPPDPPSAQPHPPQAICPNPTHPWPRSEQPVQARDTPWHPMSAAGAEDQIPPHPTRRVPQSKAAPRMPPTMPPQGTEGAQVRPRAQQGHSSVHRPATLEGRSQGGSPPPLGANSTPQCPAGSSAQRPRAPTTRSPAPAQPQPTVHPPNLHGPPRPRW